MRPKSGRTVGAAASIRDWEAGFSLVENGLWTPVAERTRIKKKKLRPGRTVLFIEFTP
jgi:hypothetical protein